jgi:hypothetical protein
MSVRVNLGGLSLALALWSGGVASAAWADNSAAFSPREAYNEGTKQLREGKLREAESTLQTAVASNEEKVQSAALYNLGHVRFKQGVEALKDAPKGDGAKARADGACAAGSQAIAGADEALAGNEVAAITRAYMRGKGVRKELKGAMEAVKKALEAHGAVLARWQRAAGDFKSAHELRPALDDARFNAEVVDRCIAALIDQQELMKMAMKCTGGTRKELQERMRELKKRMPEGQQKELAGEEEEDEDEDKPPQEPKSGMREQEHQDGREMALTWEEAMRLLNSLKLDANRKLPMGDKESANPKPRRGKDW